ncbi:hypothetical protein FACS189499_03830 [Clostridia bacterium]|nr:hypothetical protein FACS189499_03830 [Clostridia bacterium]
MNIQTIGNGKAVIITDGVRRVLFSYDTPIMTDNGGKMCRHWDGWTATTGKHIKEFSGLSKAQFNALDYVDMSPVMFLNWCGKSKKL